MSAFHMEVPQSKARTQETKVSVSELDQWMSQADEKTRPFPAKKTLRQSDLMDQVLYQAN